MSLISAEATARTCYEAHRAYHVSQGHNDDLPWDLITQEERQALIDSVYFTIENKELPPHEIHAKKVDEMKVDGWRYGEALSCEDKTHPHLVEFDNLPESEKRRQHLHYGIVHSLTNEF